MNPQDIVKKLQSELDKKITHFAEEAKKLRTGRAHTSMVDNLLAPAYGSSMPLLQLATISCPEPQMIQISPFDPSTLQGIVTMIRENQSLGLNPMDDGRVIRLNIPALTTERRQQIVKQLGEKVEEEMVAIRGCRHEAMKSVDQAKKDKIIGEDEAKRLEKSVDEAMAKTKSEIDSKAKDKEKEIMTL
jgi:ribosome recycling factor